MAAGAPNHGDEMNPKSAVMYPRIPLRVLWTASPFSIGALIIRIGFCFFFVWGGGGGVFFGTDI